MGGIFIAKELTVKARHEFLRCFHLVSDSEEILPNDRCEEEVLGTFTFCEWKNLYFIGMSDSMYRLAGRLPRD